MLRIGPSADALTFLRVGLGGVTKGGVEEEGLLEVREHFILMHRGAQLEVAVWVTSEAVDDLSSRPFPEVVVEGELKSPPRRGGQDLCGDGVAEAGPQWGRADGGADFRV